MSDKNVDNLYRKITDPIMDLRLELREHGSPGHEALDSLLFTMTNKIWRDVEEALKLNQQQKQGAL